MTDALDTTQAADPGPAQDPNTIDRAALQRTWVAEIERYDRKAQQFVKRGKLAQQRYTAEKKDEQANVTTFNILWSNIQTLKPALYSKDPTPEVERRFKDKDPIGLAASEVLERACTNLLAMQKFGDSMRMAVEDRLVPGRGVMWVRYLPHFRTIKDGPGEDEKQGAQAEGKALTNNAPQDVDEVTWEEVKFDFVPWTDFGHTVARTWPEVYGCWRICYLDRAEVKKRFSPEVAQRLPFDQDPDGLTEKEQETGELRKTKIYEIWDRRNRRVIRLHKAQAEVLEVQEDPYGLEDFWPLPEPLHATTSSRSIIPTPDGVMWQDQARELDRLSHRITMLTRAIKVVGVYDSSVPALAQLLNGGNENVLVPVDAWAAFAEKGGFEGSVALLDVKQVAEILLNLYEARDKVKADIYEISGMSDLLRGASDPEETAAAQKIKASYASVRLKDMQRQVQVFARDAIKIAAEIICNLFKIDTIKQLSGMQLMTQAEKAGVQQQLAAVQQYQQRAQQMQQAQAQQQPPQPGMPPQAPQQPAPNPAMVLGPPPPQPTPDQMELMRQPAWEEVEQLLRDMPARNFRIDIETDSTILQDERAEQEQRLEFGKMVAELVQQAESTIQTVPELAPAIAETFMFILRSFKVGRSTETAFQEAMDKLIAKAAQPGPRQENPEVQTEQIKQQGETQRAQGTAQIDMQKMQLQMQMQKQMADDKLKQEMQLEQVRMQAEFAHKKYEADLNHEREQTQQARDHEFRMATMAQRGAQHDQAMQQQAMQTAAAPVGGA